MNMDPLGMTTCYGPITGGSLTFLLLCSIAAITLLVGGRHRNRLDVVLLLTIPITGGAALVFLNLGDTLHGMTVTGAGESKALAWSAAEALALLGTTSALALISSTIGLVILVFRTLGSPRTAQPRIRSASSSVLLLLSPILACAAIACTLLIASARVNRAVIPYGAAALSSLVVASTFWHLRGVLLLGESLERPSRNGALRIVSMVALFALAVCISCWWIGEKLYEHVMT